MTRPRALDLFSGAGGCSVGLQRAGFDVTAVDIAPQPHHRGGEFVQADAMEVLKDRAFLRTFDFVHASPPCQGYSSLRHLTKGKAYPKLIEAVRFLLERSGVAWSIENVPGAPLRGNVTLLCGTMFGLQTRDGRAELRRHRLFETSFSIPLRPACQHGHETITVTGDRCNSSNTPRVICVAGDHPHSPAARHDRPAQRRRALGVTGHAPEISPTNWPARPVITVSGDRPNSSNTPRKVLCVAGGKAMSGGMMTPRGEFKRRAISVTGHMAQTNLERNTVRETFTVEDARHAMGLPPDWELPMRYLSQAIPPIYATWIGRQALGFLLR